MIMRGPIKVNDKINFLVRWELRSNIQNGARQYLN